MSPFVATLLFASIVAGLLVLPFLPALREVRRARDVQPLAVSADGRVFADYFAQRFRAFVEEQFAGPLTEARRSRQILHGRSDAQNTFVALPPGTPLAAKWTSAHPTPVVLSGGDLPIDSGVHLDREVYVDGPVSLGQGVHLRALLAEGSADAGDGLVVQRWLHAAGNLQIGRGARLYGRISSDGEIHLGTGSCFLRLAGRRVVLGTIGETPAPFLHESAVPVDPSSWPGFVGDEGGRVLVHGDLELPAAAAIDRDLVVRGRLRLGPGCRIDGSLKARSIEIVGQGRIEGALVAREDIVVGAGTRVRGPVIAEGDLVLGADTEIGDRDRRATVRARRARIAGGVVVHGSLWIEEKGEIR